jgi:NhaA family Na+:H+ antiporter
MAIFFLVAGLELKRELLVGELSTRKNATLPVIAAIGGIVMPALIFVAFNNGQETIGGWGIPVATDIAYSLGIIGLLGNRVPRELKVLIVGIAIADDLGAVLIIAAFYTSQISWPYLLAGGVTYGILWVINFRGVKGLRWYLLIGLALWYFVLKSGIHPTIAGVLLAFVIPSRPRIDSAVLKRRTEDYMAMLAETDIERKDPLEDRQQRRILRKIARDTKLSRPPLLKLENALTGFNAYFIIPVFALANAGVQLSIPIDEILNSKLALGILFGLVLGKALGISIFGIVGKALGLVEIPSPLRSAHIVGLGFIAGIGFTMSLFITGLAFEEEVYIQLSKISILAASAFAAIIGIVTLSMTGNKQADRSGPAEL